MKPAFDVLVISPTPTHPSDQGNRKRIRQVCEEMQRRGGRIHFVYFPREWSGKVDLDAYTAMNEAWDFFHLVAPNYAPYQTDKAAWDIDDWWDPTLGTFIGWLCNNTPFDMAIVNYAFFSKALEHIPQNILKILDTHDQLSDRKDLLARNNLAPEFFYTTVEQEKIALDRADLVLAIKDEERAFFQTITNKPVMTLGHNEDERFIERPVATDRPLRLGFLGSENSINRKNLERFLQIALPLMSAEKANIEIVVAGSISRYFTSGPRVHVIGRVGDVREFYELVDVCINPFEFSTGLKIKVVEGLSFGGAVVGTVNAFEGIKTRLPYHQFHTTSELASFCINLSRDRRGLDTMFAECRQVFRAMCRDVSDTYDNIIALMKQRSLVVATADFYLEQTAEQRRVAELIRLMAENTRCILLYPYPANEQVRKGINDWQWCITTLFPLMVDGTDLPKRLKFGHVVDVAEAYNAGVVALLAPEYIGSMGTDRLIIQDIAGPGALERAGRYDFAADAPTVVTTDLLTIQAAVCARVEKTPVYYIPGLHAPRGEPDAESFRNIWILCQGVAQEEMELITRLIRFLGGDWRVKNSRQVHVIYDGAPPAAAMFPTVTSHAVGSLDSGDLPPPHLMVDLAADNARFHGSRLEALLSHAPLIQLACSAPAHTPPGYQEAAMTVTGVADLLYTCHAISASVRIRRNLIRRNVGVLSRWYGPAGLEPLRQRIKSRLLDAQKQTLISMTKSQPSPSIPVGTVTTDNFDEVYYLSSNPDVAKAVSAGDFSSGLDHFKLHGLNENRPFRLIKTA